MKKHIQKDLNRRFLVKLQEHKRISLKAIQQNKALSSQVRLVAFIQLTKLKTKGSPVQVRNRCVLTGRSRGIYNYLKISRIMIRTLTAKGLLPGIKKASW